MNVWPDEDLPEQPRQQARGDSWWPCLPTLAVLTAVPVAALLLVAEALS